MHPIDWIIVFLLNAPIILFALVRARDTKTSSDWFLARRSLPWWIVGLSMYATAIDASDMVADSGGAYRFGIRLFVLSWVGIVAGWVFMAQWIIVPMYRSGMYTNAEYLEARFTPSVRIISALIQVLYRTVVMGIIGTTIYLTLREVADWPEMQAWMAVVAIATVATIYTVLGGLRSVAVTDALQSGIMLLGSLVLFTIVFSSVGGWQGMKNKLAARDSVDDVLHVGSPREDIKETSDLSPGALQATSRLLGGTVDPDEKRIVTQTSGWLISVYFVIVGLAYSIVNHTQTMRMLGAKSEWDIKMAVVLASVVMIVVTFLNLSMGLLGRALYDLQGAEVDTVYPKIIRDFAGTGFRGVVVAGIVAASFSTYDSIGSTISTLLTRDVYARWLSPGRTDSHYLNVGRWLTPLIIFGSFAYVPFLLKEGMILFYLGMVGAFVVPLLTIYLMGALTRVHRRSAIVGLIVGVGYGIVFTSASLVAEKWEVALLRPPFSNQYAVVPIGMLMTGGAMVIYSLIFGWQASAQVSALSQQGWLQSTSDELQELISSERKNETLPTILMWATLGVGIVLSFVLFW
jgi:SSS family solute:Na+ symporter